MEPTREDLLKALKLADQKNDQRAIRSITGRLKAIDEKTSIDPDVMVESDKKRQSEELGVLEWLKENAKIGSVEGIAGASAIATAVGRNWQQLGSMVGLNEAPEKGFMETLSDSFTENRDTALMFMQDVGVYNKPRFTEQELRDKAPVGGMTGDILTAGVRAASDPIGALSAPAKWGAQALRVGGDFIAGMGAEAGAQGAEQMGYGETGQFLGALAGGTAAGLSSAVTQGAIEAGLSTKAGQTLKEALELRKMGAKEGIKQVELTVAGRTAQNLLKDAVENNFADLEGTIKRFDEIKDILGVENFPLMTQLADNEVLRQKFLELSARDPKFRAKMESELNSLVDGINAKADELFGTRDARLADAGMQINPDMAKNLEKAEKAVQSLDQRLTNMGVTLDAPTQTELGNKIQNIITAKEQAVRSGLSEEYNALRIDAKRAGVQLPASAVKSLHQFVKANNVVDLFGRRSRVDKEVLSKLAPKIIEREDGVKIREYKPLTFDQVVSLKNAINDELRLSKGDKQIERRLMQFKDVLDDQRQYLGEFDARLRDIDRSFYEKMGIPYDSRTISDLSSKGYAELVAPVLMRPSAAKQFLDTVGEAEGMDILQNTIMSKAYASVVDQTSGTLNSTKLSTFINKNADVIDMVPDLRNKLETTLKENNDLLRAHKAAQDELNLQRQNTKAAQVLLDNPDLQFNLSAVVADPSKARNLLKFQEQVKLFDPATQAVLENKLRRELVNEAIKQRGDGALVWLREPSNRPVIEAVMGKQYMKDLEAMAELSDAIRKSAARTQLNLRGDEYDPAMRAVDVPTKQIASVVRDRIMSNTQKVIVLLSKANSNRTAQATDAKMAEMFLDPNTIRKMAVLEAQRKAKGEGMDMNLVVKRATEILAEKMVMFNRTAINRELSRQADSEFQNLPEQQGPLQVEVTQGQR